MAFEIKIKGKSSIFKKTQKINTNEIIRKLGFEIGSYNDAYVLQFGEVCDNTCVIYNPNCIGRGIFMDTSNLVESNEISLSYNIPTTSTEINDFFKLSQEIIDNFGKVGLYNNDETFTTSSFFAQKESMIEFSLKTLNKNASFEFNKNSWLITTAMFPYTFSDDERNAFINATNLDEFEKRLHEIQLQDVYYAKPSLFYDENQDVNIAVYTLTEDCRSVFPLIYKNSPVAIKLNTSIDVGWVRFCLYYEKRFIDGYFDYAGFIELIKDKSNEYFDKDHIIIPPINKEELIEIADFLKENGSLIV